MKVLIIAAHPDDEVLGCGGTAARMSEEGHDVSVAILGEGMTSRYDTREQADSESAEKLLNSAKRARETLGVNRLHTYNLPDNRFDTLPLLEIIKIVEKVIKTENPDTVYTHHAGDLNIDHAIVNRAVLTATRPLKECPVRRIYAFEVPSSTEWSFYGMRPLFKPNVFVDISATLEKKIEAMTHYESEIQPFPHPRSSQSLITVAKRWGAVAGLKAAEAFELIRDIRGPSPRPEKRSCESTK